MRLDDTRLTLRPAADADLPFLFQVYVTTRLDELKPLDWSPDQINAFLNHQFWAQHIAYHTRAPHADYDVLLKDGQPIGRLYVERWEDEIRLMEITLLPDYRRQGIGTMILRALQAEAVQEHKCVRLYVEDYNPAYGLYTRFGFRPIGAQGIYTYMEWVPTAQAE